MTILQGSYEQAARYLRSTGQEYFTFDFHFVRHDQSFREINRFLLASRRCLGLRNKSTDTVMIELTRWNDKSANAFNEYFHAFMYFINSSLFKFSALFFVSGACSLELYSQLSRHFDLCLLDPEKGEISMPDSKVANRFEPRGA